jgi:hypothetical protein
MIKTDPSRERTLRQRRPSARRIESLIAGHVASGQNSSSLRELAELSLEVSLLRERLACKSCALQIAFDNINSQADHTWSLAVELKLEPKD